MPYTPDPADITQPTIDVDASTAAAEFRALKAFIAGAITLAGVGYGQCRFEYVSTSICRLKRYNGQYLTINGVPQSIPAAGVDLANTALAANDTTYYVYAYMNAGVMTLEAVATAHATDSVTGVEIKSGDATRTLVGMVRKTGGNFYDSTTTRFTISWFNQLDAALHLSAGSTVTTTPTILVTVYFLQFGGNAITYTAHGYGYNNSGNDHLNIGVGLDTVVSVSNVSSLDNGKYAGVAATVVELPTEGYHTIDLTAGTTYYSTVGASQRLTALIKR